MAKKIKPWVKYTEKEANRGEFVVSPLSRGMGITLGNSIRRILLATLEGHAVTAVKISGVKHEYSTIPGVKEDVLDIIKNIKSLVFVNELEEDEPKTISIDFKGIGKVSSKEINLPTGLKLVNDDVFIAELTQKGSLNIEMVVEKGIGYKPADIGAKEGLDVQYMNIDSSFSPILRVNHQVENMRVGKSLDYDSLVMDVWTDGSVTPEDAVKEASQILLEKFMLFGALNVEPEEEEEEEESEEENAKESVLKMSIDDLEFSARSANCLKRAGIETVAELIEKDLSNLMTIKNFGKKSADEIDEKLGQFGLALKHNGEFVEVPE